MTDSPHIRVDKKFREMLKLRYPGVNSSEGTRRIIDEMYRKDELSKKLDELLFGKKRRKK